MDIGVVAMKMSEITAKAKALNIKSFGMKRDDLIRSIQLAEGNFDCFGSTTAYCDQQGCAWRSLCLDGGNGGNEGNGGGTEAAKKSRKH
jgi:hypothetical protein